MGPATGDVDDEEKLGEDDEDEQTAVGKGDLRLFKVVRFGLRL